MDDQHTAKEVPETTDTPDALPSPFQATTTHINDLPSELLVHIWAHTRDSVRWYRTPTHHDKCQPNLSLSPILSISWVAHHWRSIALTSPTLWTDLLITPHTSTDLVRLKIQRSQSCLLHIRVEYTHACGCFVHKISKIHKTLYLLPHLEALMPLLAPHVARWRSLQLFLFAQDYADDLACALLDPLRHTPATHLTDLRIWKSFYHSATATATHVRYLQGTLPALKHAQFCCPCINVHTTPICVGLTSLDLRPHPKARPTPSQMRDTIHACPNLTILVLQHLSLQYTTKDLQLIPAPSVRVLKLDLAVYTEEPQHSHSLFDVLSFPNLDTLYLISYREAYLYALNTFRFPKLRSLVLGNHPSFPRDVAMLLHSVPSISHLTSYQLEPIARCLVKDIQTGTCPCPLLDTVTFQKVDPCDVPALVQLVEKRALAKLRVQSQGFLELPREVQERCYRCVGSVELLSEISPEDEFDLAWSLA